MVNGVGSVFGVLTSFSHAAGKLSVPTNEMSQMKNYSSYIIQFLGKCCRNQQSFEQRILEECRSFPEIYAGNALVDVMSGHKRQK